MQHLGDILTQTLTHLCVFLISGYLSLSGFFAIGLTHTLVAIGILEPSGETEIVTTIPEIPPTSINTESATSTKTPTPHYQTGGPIPRILLENASLQHAALSDALPTVPKTLQALVVDAIVNIYCTYREGEKIHAITGSGVFIDPSGIILTNAHVAQFLLLTKTRTNIQCVVRQGNPAQEKYSADLLYISPIWIHDNASLIDAKAPAGTGERDYALLYVTGALRGRMPDAFPSLPFTTTALTKRTMLSPVFVAGYPAPVFGKEGPRAELIPRIASTSLSDIFTFGTGEADVLALQNSVVGEQGSSGGPIVDLKGNIIGLIVTRGSEGAGAHSLRAITLSYINQTILEETGFDLSATLKGNIPRRSAIFKEALVPFLSSLLERELR